MAPGNSKNSNIIPDIQSGISAWKSLPICTTLSKTTACNIEHYTGNIQYVPTKTKALKLQTSKVETNAWH